MGQQLRSGRVMKCEHGEHAQKRGSYIAAVKIGSAQGIPAVFCARHSEGMGVTERERGLPHQGRGNRTGVKEGTEQQVNTAVPGSTPGQVERAQQMSNAVCKDMESKWEVFFTNTAFSISDVSHGPGLSAKEIHLRLQVFIVGIIYDLF